MLNCKLLKGKRPIFAFKVIVITAMNRIIENLKVNNPAIYQILQEQEKQKWEEDQVPDQQTSVIHQKVIEEWSVCR